MKAVNPWIGTGLSPLARGTHMQQLGQLAQHRFIPAGAGNTREIPGCTDLPAVYPRWRGEHAENHHANKSPIGLSPLARGTRCQLKNAVLNPPVYPRWRGEHFGVNTMFDYQCGLSPLARGTHPDRDKALCMSRFIPAGAGNTRAGKNRKPRHTVYPRWRGEHRESLYVGRYSGGLSPLARGTHLPSLPHRKA